MRNKLISLITLSFPLYLLVLFFLCFGGNRGIYKDLPIVEYALRQMNLVPFKTIVTYLHGLLTNSMNPSIALKNLCGNLLMFLPMGLYLPFFIRKLQSWKLYLFLMTAFLFIIEVIQFVTRKGAFDIDDLILNLLGAAIGFAIWNTKFVKKCIACLDNNETTEQTL